MIVKRAAFTMIEFIFVIIVLGILTSMAIPRLEQNTRQVAGDSILSAIRYAQHMALIDNVTDPRNANWQRAFWRFGVRTCLAVEGDVFYYVGSDKDRGGNIGNNEAAIDPTDKKIMLGTSGTSCANGVNNGASPEIFISHKFGIKDTNMFTQCSGAGANAARYIGFDNLGRPHTGFSGSNIPDYASILNTDCNLTFQFDDTDITDLVITIEKGTGHAYIVGQPDSNRLFTYFEI